VEVQASFPGHLVQIQIFQIFTKAKKVNLVASANLDLRCQQGLLM
jgi:hypothetical protein